MKGIKNFGIGTDIESIDRFKKFDYEKNESSLSKIFTKDELDYCFSKNEAAPHLAARFSAKEAVFKALSDMGESIQNYREIEIIHNDIGGPTVKINNEKSEKLQVKISLSHCKDKAIAFAIATKVETEERIK